MCPVVHYNQTHDAVDAWDSIRILLAAVLRNNWKKIQLDYVLDLPQVPVDREFYIKIPKCV